MTQPHKPHRTENQHWVPQMVLRGFANEKERLFCFDKANRNVYPTSIEAVCQEKYFYEIPPTNGVAVPLNAVENNFSRLESSWLPLLEGLVQSGDEGQFTEEQVCEFAPYVIIQWMRTKKFREVAYDMLVKYGQMLTNQALSIHAPDMIGKIKFCVDKRGMPGTHAQELYSWDKIERLSQDLQGRIWVIGINDTDHLFYTSDSPVVRRGNVIEDGRPNTGGSARGIEILFPLDSRHILITMERTYFQKYQEFDRRSIKLTADQVLGYNRVQVLQSVQRVFCRDDDFEPARVVCAEDPEICDPDRSLVEVTATPIIDMQSFVEVTVRP
ncbi:MAG: DUF4238 domain-containing protein [Gemmataceae bacterium]